MSKKLIIIAEAVSSAVFYNELTQELFGNAVEIQIYSTDHGLPNILPNADIYVVSATSTNIFGHVISLIPHDKSIVLVTLTFKKSQIEQLRNIPHGTKALLVNLSANMAIETIASLNRLGITQVDMMPVYPGIGEIPNAELAITPGEQTYVPDNITNIIDLGYRVYTSETITEIALKLGYNWFLKSEKYYAYLNELMESGESVAMLWMESMRMENYLEMLMGSLDFGVLGVNMERNIFAANSIAQTITGMSREMIGMSLDDMIPEIGKTIPCGEYDKKIAKLIQLNDSHISVSVTPILWKGESVGHFILLQRFTDEEKRQNKFRLQMYHGGYKSKYTFEDIIGESPAISKTKSAAKKMAKTDASVLLTGESGTGKELFAHAIHFESDRENMPFVAINCAALPEALLESELFGYAEGAFTGAKKGGKLGLFEYAHKGTLFLDELEGMSHSLQLKLLRVLQEKEMMRVGDNKIISIDVRIIAASNENILERVHKGTFRRDLYYRLNTLPINIPPLRERGDDLFLIIEAVQQKLGIHFQLSHEAEVAFKKYYWDGNIRELINIVEFLRYEEKETIELDDLPQILLEQHSSEKKYTFTNLKDNRSHSCDLEVFYKAAKGKEEAYSFIIHELACSTGIGRNALCILAQERGILLTEQEARGILTKLNQLGIVSVSRGRGGSQLTVKGRELEKKLNN